MGNIVSKFGGTSVATKEKIITIKSILKQNELRKCVILSAPGKSKNHGTKVTDLLIRLSNKSLRNESINQEITEIKQRFLDIYAPLGLARSLINDLCHKIDKCLAANKDIPLKFRDAIVALGEDLNAQLMAAYLNLNDMPAEYVSPEQAGLIVTSVFGDAQPKAEAFENLLCIKELCKEKIVIFPGFFGITRNHEIATFNRGGSDLTASILAEVIDAKEYENWTDVNGIMSANPQFVDKPIQIPALTYKEMRELSYMGFQVFHEEAVKPAMRRKIPIRVRNTHNLENEGTLIVAERLPSERDIVGISSCGKFCTFTIEKFLMNRELGFGRKLLAIFEDMGISFEHCPSGVDNISVVINQNALQPDTANNLMRTIERRLKPDNIRIEFDIALVAVVGEGLLHKIGVLAQAARALARQNINIKMINQGSSELSIIFGIDVVDEKKAVYALYQEFFH